MPLVACGAGRDGVAILAQTEDGSREPCCVRVDYRVCDLAVVDFESFLRKEMTSVSNGVR